MKEKEIKATKAEAAEKVECSHSLLRSVIRSFARSLSSSWERVSCEVLQSGSSHPQWNAVVAAGATKVAVAAEAAEQAEAAEAAEAVEAEAAEAAEAAAPESNRTCEVNCGADSVGPTCLALILFLMRTCTCSTPM